MYPITHLEEEWKKREFDLFPCFEGFYSLLCTREVNLQRAERKLHKVSAGTLVQFLNSEDKDISQIAGNLIQLFYDQDLVTGLLVYSLMKVKKSKYAERVGDCLAGCLQPQTGLRYLFDFLHKFPEINETFAQVFLYYWKKKIFSLSRPDEYRFPIREMLQTIGEHLKEDIPDLAAIHTLKEFRILKKDLLLPLNLCYFGEQNLSIKMVYEEELREFGRSIGSLQGLIEDHLSENIVAIIYSVVPFIGILRLEKDKEYLRHLKLILTQSQFQIVNSHKVKLENLLDEVIAILESPREYPHIGSNFASDLFFTEWL